MQGCSTLALAAKTIIVWAEEPGKGDTCLKKGNHHSVSLPILAQVWPRHRARAVVVAQAAKTSKEPYLSDRLNLLPKQKYS